VLDADGCGLEVVPQAFSALTALTSLGLSANSIVGGWQHLQPMQQLVLLDIDTCDCERPNWPELRPVVVRLLVCSLAVGAFAS
jgi:hypothetical protein